ncbi:hypothetical protein ATO3_18940 [Marinibacterium profundimaris]|uniref:Polysaccharide pyruvyl transferase domain-containing protein n=1 Tax=Marinibacterium profundimaris TaxID=1679460 RepID=A0A225NII7_9RHOB|nr:hypothetical protein ATO3_18940 [Marinibacterium profundimaris]
MTTLRRPRVGILTYHFSENFGALMQAYGLQTWLREQGCDAEFINYHPSHVEEGGSFWGNLVRGKAKGAAKVAFLRFAAVKRRIKGEADHTEVFLDFQRDVLGVHGPALPDGPAVDAWLAGPEGRFDMLVCGSDQIWAPSDQFGVDPVYYLRFPGGAQGARRISYAPSFGRAKLDKTYAAEVKSDLERLDGVSVREQSGVDIVREITGRDAACVPDPTILLGDFSGLVSQAKTTPADGHVFCYALRTGQRIRDVAMLAGEQTGGAVLSPYNVHRRWPEIGETITPTPAEWVAYAQKAAFIVTNSFHGTVFAILFRKPFLTVGLPGKRAGLNERSKNLLSTLGLMDRFIPEDLDEAGIRARMEAPIDWEAAGLKLAALQEDGRSYLRGQLEQLRFFSERHAMEVVSHA